MVTSSLHCWSQFATISSKSFAALFVFILLALHVPYALVKLMYILAMCFPNSVPWIYLLSFIYFSLHFHVFKHHIFHESLPENFNYIILSPSTLTLTCFCTFIMTLISVCITVDLAYPLLLDCELPGGSTSDSFVSSLQHFMTVLTRYNAITYQLHLFLATWSV